MWACIKRKISYSPWKNDIKWWSVIVIKVEKEKFEISMSRRSCAWSFLSPLVIMNMWRCSLMKLSHSGVWGRKLWVFKKQQRLSESFRLEWNLKRHHQDKMTCARKSYGIARFSFYQCQGVCWQTRLQDRYLHYQKGFRLGNLIMSSQGVYSFECFAYSYSCLFLVFPCVRFLSLFWSIFSTSSSSLQTEFVGIFYCVYEYGGFVVLHFWWFRVSPHLVFNILLFLGFYCLC
jgi:hypothetical protein